MCKEKCVCSKRNGKCDAFGHRQCSVSSAIVKKSCGKAACKAANREIISPACETPGIAGRKQIRKMNADSLDSSEEENDISEEEENNSEEEETTAIAKRRIEHPTSVIRKNRYGS